MTRGAYLERHTPMPRGKPIARRRRRRLDRETREEALHKALVMLMDRCLAEGIGPCDGPLQGAHLAPCRGTGLPHGTGEDVGPLCHYHHDQYDGRAYGPLRDFPHAERMELGAGWIREARAFVAGAVAAGMAPF